MAEEQQPPQVVFQIDKIYVKDLSVEVPNAPAVFLEREAPEISVDLATNNTAVGTDVFESTIRITVTAKLGDKTLFLIECEQAGLFHISGLPQDQLSMALGIGCPNIIFPYARETISDVVLRAGFPPLQLAPFNFEGEFLRRQQMAAGQAQQGSAQ
jgi:preprotein translocase subunit SecB